MSDLRIPITKEELHHFDEVVPWGSRIRMVRSLIKLALQSDKETIMKLMYTPVVPGMRLRIEEGGE